MEVEAIQFVSVGFSAKQAAKALYICDTSFTARVSSANSRKGTNTLQTIRDVAKDMHSVPGHNARAASIDMQTKQMLDVLILCGDQKRAAQRLSMPRYRLKDKIMKLRKWTDTRNTNHLIALYSRYGLSS